MKLADVVSSYKNHPFYFVIHTRDASKVRFFLDSIKDLDASEAVIVASPFRQTLKDIREERPRWLFTTPPAYLMRVQMMHSLFIETMADIWPDILVAQPENEKISSIPQGVVEEFLKRHKRIIVETESLETYSSWKLKVPNAGLLTNRLDLALEVMKTP